MAALTEGVLGFIIIDNELRGAPTTTLESCPPKYIESGIAHTVLPSIYLI